MSAILGDRFVPIATLMLNKSKTNNDGTIKRFPFIRVTIWICINVITSLSSIALFNYKLNKYLRLTMRSNKQTTKDQTITKGKIIWAMRSGDRGEWANISE